MGVANGGEGSEVEKKYGNILQQLPKMRNRTIGHLSVLPPEIRDADEGKISVEKDYMLNTMGLHRDFKHRQLTRL